MASQNENICLAAIAAKEEARMQEEEPQLVEQAKQMALEDQGRGDSHLPAIIARKKNRITWLKPET